MFYIIYVILYNICIYIVYKSIFCWVSLLILILISRDLAMHLNTNICKENAFNLSKNEIFAFCIMLYLFVCDVNTYNIFYITKYDVAVNFWLNSF